MVKCLAFTRVLSKYSWHGTYTVFGEFFLVFVFHIHPSCSSIASTDSTFVYIRKKAPLPQYTCHVQKKSHNNYTLRL